MYVGTLFRGGRESKQIQLWSLSLSALEIPFFFFLSPLWRQPCLINSVWEQTVLCRSHSSSSIQCTAAMNRIPQRMDSEQRGQRDRQEEKSTKSLFIFSFTCFYILSFEDAFPLSLSIYFHPSICFWDEFFGFLKPENEKSFEMTTRS